MGGQTDLRGENGLIVELILDPGDEVVDVLWRTAFDGFLDVDPISPQILEAAMVRTENCRGVQRTGGHNGAGLWSAKLSDAAIEEIDLVKEINGCIIRNRTTNSILLTASHSFRSSF